jgi:hypothetical protein
LTTEAGGGKQTQDAGKSRSPEGAASRAVDFRVVDLSFLRASPFLRDGSASDTQVRSRKP